MVLVRLESGSADTHDLTRTIVPSINSSEQLLVLLHQIRQLQHEDSSLRGRQPLPRRVPEGFVSREYCSVNIFRSGTVHSGDLFLGTAVNSVRQSTFM